jgi:HK97 family phage portal protein
MPSLIQRLFGKKIGTPAPLVPGMITRQQATASLHTRPHDYDELTAAFESVPTLRTCVDLIASTTAQTTLRVYAPKKSVRGFASRPMDSKTRKRLASSKGPNGRKAREAAATDETLEEITDPAHPAVSLIDTWNPVDNAYAGLFQTARELNLYGGVHIAMIGDQIGVSELWPLVTPRVWTIADAERGYPYIVAYRYGESLADATQEFKPDDIIRIGVPSITNRLRFHSPYQSCIHELRQLYQFTRFNTSTLENGGALGGVVSGVNVNDQKTMDALQRQFENKFGGESNAGRIWFMPKDVTYTDQQLSRELSFIEGDKAAQAKVFKAAGIPMTLLEQENANLAGAAKASPQFVSIAINPVLRQIEDALNAQLAPRFGGGVVFGFDPVNPEESGDAAVAVSLYSGRLLTLNESRKYVGYDPVDGGDTFAEVAAAPDPLGGIGAFFAQRPPESPLSFEEPEPTQNTTQTPEPAQEPTKALPAPVKSILYTDLAFGLVEDCGCHNAEPPKGLRATKDDRRDVDKEPGYAEASRKVEAAMREAFGPLYEQALAIAATNTDPDQIERLVAGLIRSNGAEFRAAIEPTLLEVFQRGYTTGAEGIAPDLGAFEVLSDRAVEAFDERMSGFIADIGETTGQQIGSAMRSALEAGATPKEAADFIREKVPDITAHRAELIARTETSRALLMGRRAAWKELPGVIGAEYLLSSNPCDLCVAVSQKWSGRYAPINEPFVKVGETIAGVTFNRDIWDNPHPQCRCSIAPVLEPLND